MIKSQKNFTKIHVRFVGVIFSKFKRTKMKKIFGRLASTQMTMIKYSPSYANHAKKKFMIKMTKTLKKVKKMKKRLQIGLKIE